MWSVIQRCIVQGFRVANRSLAGMGCFAAGWILMAAFIVGVVLASGVSRQLESPAASAPAASADAADSTAADDETQPAATAPAAGQSQQAAVEQLGRIWPIVAIVVLAAMAAGTFLYGAQIGYLAKQIRDGSATAADFLAAGKRAFVPVLLAGLLSMLVAAGAAVVVLLFGAVASMLPGAVSGVLSVILGIAAFVGMIWVGVRLAFWYVAIAGDGKRPVEGLRTSWALTAGRWWQVALFVLAIIVVMVVAGLPLGLLEGIGTAVGGAMGGALRAISNILQLLLINLYLGFVSTAALIAFYQELKKSPAKAA